MKNESNLILLFLSISLSLSNAAQKGLGSSNPTSTTAINVPYQFGVGSTNSSPLPGVFTFGATPVSEV